VTTEAAIIEDLLKLARRHGAAPAALTWLVRAKQAAMVLLFAPAGRDARGQSRWLVGDPIAPVPFTSRSAGVRYLQMLAERKQVAVELICEAGDEAARKLLKRAIAELHRYSPALADELGTFSIEKGIVHYRRRGDSPYITRSQPRSHGGNAAGKLTLSENAPIIEAEFSEEQTT
jgi:hypothetical protein